MLEDYTPQSNFPYLIGIYLAVNALPDAYLYVDGPDCAFYKAQFIFGKHDQNSTLVDSEGSHRIRMSDVTVNRVVVDRTELLKASITEMSLVQECSAVLLTSMPMATITGTQYDLLLRDLRPELDKPLVEIPALSLSGDWLDGYAETLAALAQSIPCTGTPEPGKVAIVGNMMDRNERDHLANVDELERMVKGLGLDPVSIWLSGRPLAHLSRVGEAETIISLPHGRKAARILAKRTGARVLETDIPFGLKPTIDWLSQIAEALECEPAAAAFIDSELSMKIPAIQWLLHRYFQDINIFFVGDPHIFGAAAEFFSELGCRVVGMVGVGQQSHLDPLPDAISTRGIPAICEANPFAIQALVESLPADSKIDLAIQSHTHGWPGKGDYATVPFGFACPWWHAVWDTPYLGFSGALSFIDRMANALMARYHNQRR
jgi:nitrogenase molybdenum-iron protein alpha/beta subunit